MKKVKEKNIKLRNTWYGCWPGDRPPKFLRPYLLLLLLKKESHGYELFERLKKMGLNYDVQDAGYIYRKLRTMESEGLIISKWETKEIGPARRVYRITPMGIISLEEWEKSLSHLKNSLDKFLNEYKKEKPK